MTDAERTDEILHQILKAVEPDQRERGSVERIITALQAALTFQMALVCPDFRKRVARRLRSDIPGILTKASALARDAQQQYGERHFLH